MAAPPAVGLVVLIGLLLMGCGGGSTPLLQVDDVAFERGDVAGLSTDHLLTLAGITVLQNAMGAPDGMARAGRLHEERLMRERRVERLREETILQAAGVSEADLERRYLAQPAWELEVRHLVILAEPWEASPIRAQAREKASQALAEIRRGDPFEAVVARWSEEPGAATRGGLLRPGREGTWVRPFWEAAIRLEVGEVSGVVETPFGFHVLRLEARRALPFQAARWRVVREVAAQLGGGEVWEVKRDGWLSELEIIEPSAAPHPAYDNLFQVRVAETSDAIFARWPGGSLTEADLRLDLLSHRGRPDREESRIQAAAELALLEARAAEAGIHVTPDDVAAEMQAFSQQAAGWAAALGLEPGGTAEVRAARALEALRRTGQNAGLARDQIRDMAGVLLGGADVVIWNP